MDLLRRFTCLIVELFNCLIVFFNEKSFKAFSSGKGFVIVNIIVNSK